jgi:DNA-binding NtrC family response regulator
MATGAASRREPHHVLLVHGEPEQRTRLAWYIAGDDELRVTIRSHPLEVAGVCATDPPHAIVIDAADLDDDMLDYLAQVNEARPSAPVLVLRESVNGTTPKHQNLYFVTTPHDHPAVQRHVLQLLCGCR